MIKLQDLNSIEREILETVEYNLNYFTIKNILEFEPVFTEKHNHIFIGPEGDEVDTVTLFYPKFELKKIHGNRLKKHVKKVLKYINKEGYLEEQARKQETEKL